MGWLTSFFAPFTLNPALAAAGAGLVAVPIVIHLINRMRYRRVRFAAMEFLLASQERNRSRVLIEQLLLLLLRILIVLALILLLARLILDPAALAMIRAGAQTHHVVLLDDSGSMRAQMNGATAFDEAKKIVRQFASEAGRERGTQQLTLLLLSRAGANEAVVSERTIDDRLLEELDTKLRNLQCTHQALDLQTGLAATRERLGSARGGQRYLHLLSDFRRRDWLDQTGLQTEVSTLASAGIGVNLVRLTDRNTTNRAITAFGGDTSTMTVGIPSRVNAEVTNRAESVSQPTNLNVMVNGQPLPVVASLGQIEPNRNESVQFDLLFPAAGRQAISVGLPPDEFPSDDRRYAAIDVGLDLPALIIDGTPGENSEAQLLATALAPAPNLSGINPQIKNVDFLRRNPLRSFRVILMVNVPSLPPDAVRILESYVRDGGGLAWFVGDSVQPEAYASNLLKTADNPEGLFPLPLATAPATRERPQSGPVDIQFEPVGRFALFAGDLSKFWQPTFVSRYFAPATGWERNDSRRADGVETIARIANGDPVLLRHQVGSGEVVTMLTSAGLNWTNWPLNPIYVAYIQELFRQLATRRQADQSLISGQPLQFDFAAGEYEPEIRIERPDGTIESLRTTPVTTAASDGSETFAMTALFRETDSPGIYRTFLTPSNSGTIEERWVAVNVPLVESDLELADAAKLRDAFTGHPNISLRDPGDTRWLRVQESGRDVRLFLIAFLIVLLVVEQATAYKLSYHPRSTAMLHT